MNQLRTRRRALAFGAFAEEYAVRFLEGRGQTICARNFRTWGGEIDIVALDGGILCFVEVRARRSLRFGAPVETITPQKRARVAAAARAYLLDWPAPLPVCRFDVVELMGQEPVLRFVPGAFEVEP